MTAPNQASERDDLTLRMIALADGITLAAARREAIATYCSGARATEPWIEAAVDAALRSRARRRGNVLPLRRPEAVR